MVPNKSGADPLGGALWARPTPWSGSRHARFSCNTGGRTRPCGVMNAYKKRLSWMEKAVVLVLVLSAFICVYLRLMFLL
jgi:hypothetical protein